MKPLLVFDYDGTIHNTMGIYEPSFRKAYQWLMDEGLVEPEEVPASLISSWLGINAEDMWNSFQPGLEERYKKEASGRVGDSMAQMVRDGKAKWYEGAEEELAKLKEAGYTMVILSNCKIQYRKTHWEIFDMGRWFDRFYDCESYGFAPKTEIIKEIQKEYQEKLIVIGDRKSDMDCAVSSGNPFIACDYGFAPEGELKDADHRIASVTQLAETIMNM